MAGGSFIPKKTPGQPERAAVRQGKIVGIFGYISYVIFFGALLLSLGMFGLSYYVQSNLVDQQEQLLSIQNDIDTELIQDLISFDQYLRTVETVYAQSFSVLPLLQTFGNVIADPVFFDDLRIRRTGTNLSVQGNAVADSFDATLFQQRIAASDSILTNFAVDDVRYLQDATGAVSRFVGESGATSTLSTISADELVTFAFELALASEALPFSLSNYRTPSLDSLPSQFTEEVSDTDTQDPDDFEAERIR